MKVPQFCVDFLLRRAKRFHSVRLAARAFYDDFSTKGDNQTKTGRSDNRGMSVVVLDALTRHQWFREEDLAKSLKLHSKQLRLIGNNLRKRERKRQNCTPIPTAVWIIHRYMTS